MSFKRLFRSEDGSAMIEFALLAPVFFMLVMGLVEFVLYQYKSYALNHVVYEAARNLQTGEIQTSATVAKPSKDWFVEEVCAQAGPMIDCTKIDFDVRSFDTVAAVTFTPPVFDADGKAQNFVFTPGGANKFTVVRASYPYKFVTPFMAQLFGGGNGASPAMISSYNIVKNEPWS